MLQSCERAPTLERVCTSYFRPYRVKVYSNEYSSWSKLCVAMECTWRVREPQLYKEKQRCPMFGLHDKQTNMNTKVFNAGFTADTKTHRCWVQFWHKVFNAGSVPLAMYQNDKKKIITVTSKVLHRFITIHVSNFRFARWTNTDTKSLQCWLQSWHKSFQCWLQCSTKKNK